MRGWDEIERVDGFAGLKARIDTDVMPLLSGAPPESLGKDGAPKGAGGAMTLAMGLAIVLFLSTFLWLPDTWWGTILRLILFFVFFLGSIAFVLWLNRGKIGGFMARMAARITARSKAMEVICDHMGICFVAMPGGAPRSLMIIAGHKWAPPEVKAFGELAQGMGGMDAAVAAARAAGLMRENTVVLGSEETRRKYKEAAQQDTRVEDGFHGVRAGVTFDAFEWVESQSEADDIFHLCIVLQAPLALNGVTELRARKLPWISGYEGPELSAVDLGPKAFDAKYRLRASDQTEARAVFNPAVIERVLQLAHDAPFRAIARDQHLVLDFKGANRFEIMDISTGAFSQETLLSGVADIAEILELVDALAHAFMVRRNGM